MATESGVYWPTEGWRTSRPEDQDMDSSLLTEAVAHADNHLPYLHSLIVIRHGHVVLEKHWQDPQEPHSLFSVAKSVIATLIGITIHINLLDSIDQPVASILPEYFTDIDDRRKLQITVRNLLTMRSGINFPDPSDEQT